MRRNPLSEKWIFVTLIWVVAFVVIYNQHITPSVNN